MKKIIFVLIAVLCLNNLFSQEWAQKAQDQNVNFYQIQEDFYSYWSTHDINEKGKGYKAFKRWENFVERRVYPSGNLSLLSLTAKNYQEFLSNYQASNSASKLTSTNMIASTTWTAIGPMGALSGSAGGQLLKSGRMCFITIDPTNSNNLWVGAPAGGLWKSTNGGTSWTTNTDNLPVLGCSDLAIDPTNTNIMYLATGDGDAGDTRSVGVLKSTDGGVTWNTTGLSNVITNNFVIRRLILNPSNTQIILAATSGGIYRSINGGTNWTQVATGSTFDLEFKPGMPTTIYAGGTTFRLSTDGGATFTAPTTGIPTTGINRIAVAVSAANANYVYAVASLSSNSGMQGFYQSTNGGATFTQITTALNLLGYASAGNDVGGQGWYDLCITANPLNANEVVVGGVNVWRTTNAGTSWSLYGHWTGSGAPFTHADQHDLDFDAAGTLFNTNDGTVYRRTATLWQEISGTINISEIYKIGLSTLTANKWITGHQDNGTSIWNGTSYNATLGGDGMDCFIDRTNDNNMFGEYYNGQLRKSTNGGASWSTCTTGMTGTAPWVTPWKQDPQVAATLYCGYTDLFKSTNSGGSWTALTALPGAGTVNEFAIAPSNNQVIYVLKNGGIYKTTNGGTSWTNVTGTVPIGSGAPQFISIDPLDPNNAWVVLSGYSAGNKVFMTTNGGTSWINFSANLPNIPANCCVYQPGTNDRIYVGMDVGVYYRDNISANWTLYNTALPNMPIGDLDISPAMPTKLVAATFGRGVWVVDLISALPPPPPVSSYSVTAAVKCAGAIIPFTDQSTNAPNAWSWSVLPAAGVTITAATSQNPNITFPSAGNYTVALLASNSSGPGSNYNQAVSVTALPNVVVTNSVQSVCPGGIVNFSASGAGSYAWSNGGGSAATASYTPVSTTVYSVTGTTGGCSALQTATANLLTLPAINATPNNNFICIGQSVIINATGATTYSWQPGNLTGNSVTYTPAVATSYTVTGTGANGCNNTANASVNVNPLPTINATPNNSVICQGQSVTLNVTGATTYSWQPGNLSGSSVTYTPAVTTNYSVTGTDANGCVNTSNVTVNVSICTGVNLLSKNSGFSLYPNPTNGILTLKMNTAQVANVFVEVIDATGKIILNNEFIFSDKANTKEINLEKFANGVYYIKLVTGEKATQTIRIVKE
ncbi:MAG: T9SS type A sorting domain-containing protein [Bacteroidetes bacterium]|nr:T9SS type A sorting domain-containing protein [Bacteroidota bacterium]